MQEGREMGTYCICVADSLCCREEANTLLWGNYTSIKMFEKKNKKQKTKNFFSVLIFIPCFSFCIFVYSPIFNKLASSLLKKKKKNRLHFFITS